LIARREYAGEKDVVLYPSGEFNDPSLNRKEGSFSLEERRLRGIIEDELKGGMLMEIRRPPWRMLKF
jgi:hypothetical protein